MVVPHPAPVGLAGFARGVGVVLAGVPHHVEGAQGVVLLQNVQQQVGEGPAAELVGAGGQVHGAVVKGHGHHPLPGAHPLDAAGVAHMVLLLGQEFFQDLLARFACFYDKRHPCLPS